MQIRKYGYLSWFRHGPNESVPLCILSVYTAEGSEASYHNGFRHERVKVNRTDGAIEIINVHLSDSGLYFCGAMPDNHVIFGTATFIQVGDNATPAADISPKVSEEGDCNGTGFSSSLLLALGGVITTQLIVILILLYRAAHTSGKKLNSGKTSQKHSEDKQNEDPDMLNYAALNFTQNKRKPQRQQDLDTHVVYAATR
ncbi:hypothetical protein JZ751_006950 [Albula glossodonta]|uniref:Immunoglobulin V-set domain-containing protein n=1 Tax=Albula glossodonta TaxID=121402 RepID=A0A8T2P2U3_9TELE|nr:hypothetical protein JZ751_006950 [Albula glossodonta]